MADWKFRTKAEGEIKEDPIQERFFTTSDVGDLTNALIRESIQNSLDARINKTNGPAEVRFYLSSNGLLPDKYYPIISNLINHLKSENSGIEKLPDFSKPMIYLIVEDYYTTGLEGDILEDDDPPRNDHDKHNFYWFWRNTARSGKGYDDLGRWGVGKTVFSACSDINTFFGMTVRFEDGKKYLLGKSVIKWHTLKGNSEWYCPYGFYANYIDINSYFPLPFDSDLPPDNEIIKNFEKTFSTKRINPENGNDYYGLSIVIPFIKKEIDLNGIKKAVVKQYFYPIIEGKLIVEIETDNSEKYIINTENIDEIIKNIDFEDYTEQKNLKKIFLLAKKSLEIDSSDFIIFNEPPLDKAPRWQDTWLLNEKINKQIDDARFNFENGEIIPFKIPMRIQERGKDPVISWFKAFIQFDGFLNETDSYFIRDGITITGIKTVKKKGLRILVVIDEKNIARMFGYSENPAHTEFQKTSPYFRHKYVDGSSCITFITNTPSNLYNFLIRPSEGTDDEVLKGIFYMELDDEKKEKEPKQKEKEGDDNFGKNKTPPIENRISPYLVRRIEGGLVIMNNPHIENYISQFKVQLAYMVPKGNPLKKYNKWDFDLSDGSFNISTEGLTISIINENKIEVEVNQNEFKLQITGFDTERDLFIRV